MSELLDFSGFSHLDQYHALCRERWVVLDRRDTACAPCPQIFQTAGMDHGFAGMLLLGGIVSLTEISTVSTAAFTGSSLLALNNLLGKRIHQPLPAGSLFNLPRDRV